MAVLIGNAVAMFVVFCYLVPITTAVKKEVTTALHTSPKDFVYTPHELWRELEIVKEC